MEPMVEPNDSTGPAGDGAQGAPEPDAAARPAPEPVARPMPRSMPTPGEDLGCLAWQARPGTTECPGLTDSGTISMETCWRCYRSALAAPRP
jgi:hypothetical protein